MGIAIVSLLVLVVVGALAGLLFFRLFGSAATRNEDQPGDGEEEGGESQGAQPDAEKEGSFKFFLGAAAAGLGVLVNVAAVATAFSGQTSFVNNVGSALLFGLVLGVAAYFLGARKLGAGSLVVTVVAFVLGSVVAGMPGS